MVSRLRIADDLTAHRLVAGAGKQGEGTAGAEGTVVALSQMRAVCGERYGVIDWLCCRA